MAFRSLLILLTFFSFTVSFGQGKWGIRLNQNSDFFSARYMHGNTTEEESMERFTRISASVTYSGRRLVHELELFVPQIKSSSVQFPWPQILFRGPEFKNRMNSYSVRYAISKSYEVTKVLSFSLGAALNPYFLKTERVPQIENAFYNTYNILGISLNVVPAVKVDASEHLSFVLDVPVKLLDYYHQVWNVQNPAIPIRQQKMPSDHVGFFMNAFTIRLGVMYTF